MIISKTPYRISFFGGGTDYPDWYLKNGGQVLSTSIDKYIYITCRNLPNIFDENIRLVYSKIESVQNVNQIKHPAFRETLKYGKLINNLDIHYDGDLPGFSGMGSSSAFTVGLLNAIKTYKNCKISQLNLAKQSIFIEQKKIGEVVGSQDQIITAVGGFNHIIFNKNNKIKIKKVNINKNTYKTLENNLMLFYTGIKRSSSKIAQSYVINLEKKMKILKIINSNVEDALAILNNGDINDFGKLLNDTWQQKKQLSNKVSNKFIDEIYDVAINSGSLGGKITGAGGGGFIIFYVEKKYQKKLKNKLGKLKHVPFKFENKGTHIIFNSIKS